MYPEDGKLNFMEDLGQLKSLGLDNKIESYLFIFFFIKYHLYEGSGPTDLIAAPACDSSPGAHSWFWKSDSCASFS